MISYNAGDCKKCAMWPSCYNAGVFREGKSCARYVPMAAPDMGSRRYWRLTRCYRRQMAKRVLMAVAACAAFVLLGAVPS
jgi:hypothetical protein